MKKNTLITTTLAALAGLVGTASAIEGSASVDVTSAYVFRGATVNDEVNVQPDLSVTPLEGLTLGTWANFNTDSTQFDEIDFYVGYDLYASDDLSVSLGYTEYTYPTSVNEDGTGTEADREASISLSLSNVPLSPTLTAAFGLEGPFLEDGIHLAAGVSHTFDLGGNALELGGTIAYEAGDNFAENGFSYGQIDASTALGPVSVGISYIIETDDEVLAVDEDFFVTIGAGF